eukprot:6151581-Pyramimonas_sp.AAC.1
MVPAFRLSASFRAVANVLSLRSTNPPHSLRMLLSQALYVVYSSFFSSASVDCVQYWQFEGFGFLHTCTRTSREREPSSAN